MIFYKVERGDAPYFLVPTQADAKREAREHKCTWSQTDVPTDKVKLMGFINALLLDSAPHDVDGYLIHPTGKHPALAAPYGMQLQPGGLNLQPHDPEVMYTPIEEELTQDRTGPKGHRIAERAALMGTSEEIALLADRIGELDGQALGQCALAVAARFKELGS